MLATYWVLMSVSCKKRETDFFLYGLRDFCRVVFHASKTERNEKMTVCLSLTRQIQKVSYRGILACRVSCRDDSKVKFT